MDGWIGEDDWMWMFAAQRVWLREGSKDFKNEGLLTNYIRREEAMDEDERENRSRLQTLG